MKPTLFAATILACASVTAYAQSTAPTTAPATPAATGTPTEHKTVVRTKSCLIVSPPAAADTNAATGTAKVAPKQKMKSCNV